jgi:predicted DsbA family dithiol-disulfide isomerase
MGGLIPDWNSYHDPLNSVNNPSQMGPVWMEASRIAGVPIHERIWMENPPESSYPSCIAVKCAELQSSDAAEEYLRCLREAVMLQGRNIAKTEVLIELSESLTKTTPDLFNAIKFERDLLSGAGVNAFRDDLQKTRYHRIGRFPTLTFKRPNQAGVIITGYRPYKVLCDALTHIAPELSNLTEFIHSGLIKNQENQYN